MTIDNLKERLKDPNATFTAAEVNALLKERQEQKIKQVQQEAHTILELIRADNPWEVSYEQA